MSFRQYGGINYAAKNNIVKNNFTNANNLSIMTRVGQPDSLINVESTLNVYAINLTSPTITANENGVVPKKYVDAVTSGLRPKAASQCATTVPLSGDDNPTIGFYTSLVIDTYTVLTGDRVLIKNQEDTTPASPSYPGSVYNGIYIYTINAGQGTFQRAPDYAYDSDAYGAYTLVQNGTTNGNKSFVELLEGKVGIDPLLFTQFTASFGLGQGLEKILTSSATIVQMRDDLSTTSSTDSSPFITKLAVTGLTSTGQLIVKKPDQLQRFKVDDNFSYAYSTSQGSAPTLSVNDDSTLKLIGFVPSANGGAWNNIVGSGDSVILSKGTTDAVTTLTLTTQSQTLSGIKISPTSVQMSAGPFQSTSVTSAVNCSGSTVAVTGLMTLSGNLTLTGTQPVIKSSSTSDNLYIKSGPGRGISFRVNDSNDTDSLVIASNGNATFINNLNATNGLTTLKDLTVTGTVTLTGPITANINANTLTTTAIADTGLYYLPYLKLTSGKLSYYSTSSISYNVATSTLSVPGLSVSNNLTVAGNLIVTSPGILNGNGSGLSNVNAETFSTTDMPSDSNDYYLTYTRPAGTQSNLLPFSTSNVYYNRTSNMFSVFNLTAFGTITGNGSSLSNVSAPFLTTTTMPSGTYYLPYVTSSAGAPNQTPYTSGNVYYTSSTNTLTVPNLNSFGQIKTVGTNKIINNVYYQLQDSVSAATTTGQIYANQTDFFYDNNATGFHTFTVNPEPNEAVPLKFSSADFFIATTSSPTSAYILTDFTDSSQKLATTKWVQGAINVGGGGSTTFTITSNSVGTSSWSFTIPNTHGRAFTYSLYTDTPPTTAGKSNLGSSGTITYGAIVLNGSFIFCTGSMVYQPYSGTSSAMITYCAGYQQQYYISAAGGAYIPSVVSSMGSTITWSVSSNSVSENSACPPTVSGFTTVYTVSSSSSVASCYLKLVGTVVAS